jgi:branched-chain amino acid transport system ATP-binding protein
LTGGLSDTGRSIRRGGDAMTEPLLQVRQLEVVYNRVATAIQGVSLDVTEGEIVALVGTNGAGKTTTLRAISGFLPSEDVAITDGAITLRGERINGRIPHQLAKAGIILVPERENVFATLSVQDNLAFAAREDGAITIDRIHGYFPRLRDRSAQLAGYLSGGEKQMLAIGMALLCRPTLLLIDELSLGLAPIAIKELMERLRQISRELRLTVLLVEQNARAALTIADHGYVMESGRIVFSGKAAELLSHPDVREFYLGGAGQAENKSYRDIKQYRRKRRWWG